LIHGFDRLVRIWSGQSFTSSLSITACTSLPETSAISPRRGVLDWCYDHIGRKLEQVLVAQRADRNSNVPLANHPGLGRGDDLAALPPAGGVVVDESDGPTLYCLDALYFVSDVRPLVGALGAEVNLSIGHGVSVVGNDPGDFVDIEGSAQSGIGVGKTDVLRGRFSQFDGSGHSDQRCRSHLLSDDLGRRLPQVRFDSVVR